MAASETGPDVTKRSECGPDNQRALERAMKSMNAHLVNWLARKLGDKEAARDIAQAAYLRVWRYAADHEITNVKALMFKTAARLAANEYRARRRKNFIMLAETSADQLVVANVASDVPSPERKLISQDELMLVESAINAMPPKVREAFVSSRYHAMSYQEIADAMGVSKSSIEKYMIEALKILRAITHEPMTARRSAQARLEKEK